MRRFSYALAIGALLVGASVAEAQRSATSRNVPPGQRPPRGQCRVWIDGLPAGRQPRPTDCATARANAPANATIIYGDDTPFPGRAVGRTASRDCQWERTTTTVGDIIFGRRAADRDLNCRTDSRRELGAWYEVGRDRNGNVIYQRRVRTNDGRIALQRARRGSDGRMAIIEARNVRSDRDRDSDSDESRWAKAERRRVQQIRKEEKRATKAVRKAERDSDRAARRSSNERGNGKGKNR